MLLKFIIVFYCGLACSNDIVEEHLDGSRTVWKDDGSKVEIINDANALIYNTETKL